jgi:hypothetical protein
MSRTGFEHAQAPADIATGYWRLPPGGRAALRLLLPSGIIGQRVGGLVAFRPFYVNGPPYGGLVGDVQDAARFLVLHLGDGAAGGRRLLSAESAVAMRTLTTEGTKLTTGLGWWRRHEADDGSGLVEHLGGGGAYRNLMRLYPDSGQSEELDAGLSTSRSYTVESTAQDWLEHGLPGRSERTQACGRSRGTCPAGPCRLLTIRCAGRSGTPRPAARSAGTWPGSSTRRKGGQVGAGGRSRWPSGSADRRSTLAAGAGIARRAEGSPPAGLAHARLYRGEPDG